MYFKEIFANFAIFAYFRESLTSEKNVAVNSRKLIPTKIG